MRTHILVIPSRTEPRRAPACIVSVAASTRVPIGLDRPHVLRDSRSPNLSQLKPFLRLMSRVLRSQPPTAQPSGELVRQSAPVTARPLLSRVGSWCARVLRSQPPTAQPSGELVRRRPPTLCVAARHPVSMAYCPRHECRVSLQPGLRRCIHPSVGHSRGKCRRQAEVTCHQQALTVGRRGNHLTHEPLLLSGLAGS